MMPMNKISLRMIFIAVITFMVLALVWQYVQQSRENRTEQHEMDDFLTQHWQFPLRTQGVPPAHFTALEASLDAQACAECHVTQHQDWEKSRHSHTMNAGIRWQFHVFGQTESNKCMDCHAPLAEQKALVAKEMGWENAPKTRPPGYVPESLHHQGLTCAACHVREHQRFGPLHRYDIAGTESALPHSGFIAKEAFSDSRFCAACHQFPEDGPRLNGKLRQDTYNEWLNTPFAEEGIGCQQCHMPDRRHQWRGISDAEMVRRAMGISLESQPKDDATLGLTMKVTNIGAGHHLPAYMVPRIDIRLLLVDPDEEIVEELLHHVLQWRTSVDLKSEEFDQRLAFGESVLRSTSITETLSPGWSIQLVVDVAPKEHYERMYQDMMKQADKMTPATLSLLQLAIKEAAETRYRAISQRISLEQPIHYTHP